MPTTLPKISFAFKRSVHAHPRRVVGDTRSVTLSPQFSVYDGRDRVGSYRRDGDRFMAFDRRGCGLGTFPTMREAADAICAKRAS